MEPESQAIDGGEGDLVGARGWPPAGAADLLHTEDGGETVGGLRTQEARVCQSRLRTC